MDCWTLPTKPDNAEIFAATTDLNFRMDASCFLTKATVLVFDEGHEALASNSLHYIAVSVIRELTMHTKALQQI